MVDLVVWLVEVFCRRYMVDTASDVVSERAVWIGENPWEARSVSLCSWRAV